MKIREISSDKLEELKIKLTEKKVLFMPDENSLWVDIQTFKHLHDKGILKEYNVSSHKIRNI